MNNEEREFQAAPIQTAQVHLDRALGGLDKGSKAKAKEHVKVAISNLKLALINLEAK